MTESVLLNSPVLLIGYDLALFFCVFDLVKRSSGYVFPVISIVLCVITTVGAYLLGCSHQEISSVILIFLILNLTVFIKKGDKK